MIELCNVSKKFDHFSCIDHVSLVIPEGSVYGLIGENGAGKSTLLRLIAGVYQPDQGEIIIGGEKIPKVAAKKKIFYMPDNQYYERSATPLSLGNFYKAFYPKFAMEEYRDLLDRFGLKENALVDGFSKGMKKQMFIAAAICANTSCLLCDEVFDGLDPQIRKKVNKLLKNASEGRNLTILIVSHYLEELNRICTEKGFLHRGRILKEEEWNKMVLDSREDDENVE